MRLRTGLVLAALLTAPGFRAEASEFVLRKAISGLGATYTPACVAGAWHISQTGSGTACSCVSPCTWQGYITSGKSIAGVKFAFLGDIDLSATPYSVQMPYNATLTGISPDGVRKAVLKGRASTGSDTIEGYGGVTIRSLTINPNGNRYAIGLNNTTTNGATLEDVDITASGASGAVFISSVTGNVILRRVNIAMSAALSALNISCSVDNSSVNILLEDTVLTGPTASGGQGLSVSSFSTRLANIAMTFRRLTISKMGTAINLSPGRGAHSLLLEDTWRRLLAAVASGTLLSVIDNPQPLVVMPEMFSGRLL